MVTQAPPLDKLPVTALDGVGNKLAETLTKLNIYNVQDLLFHLPMRYMDRTRVVPIGELKPNTSVVIEATVIRSDVVMGRRRSLLVTLRDESGQVCLRFFHFNAAQKNQLSEGTRVRCFGDPRLGATGLELYHPEYQVFHADEPYQRLDQSLTPVYPVTEGLSQPRLRKLTKQALELMRFNPPTELLPSELNEIFGSNSLAQALSYIHFPPADAPVESMLAGSHPYQKRLAFEEMLAHHLALQESREKAQQESAPALPIKTDLLERLLASLPFKPTDAQQRVMGEIQQDLNLDTPMLRLVQGDVGSGKTLVAAAAAVAALDNKQQVALVAPTEILADQHRANFDKWFTPLGFQISWLVGKQTAKQKRETLEQISSGAAHIVVGTHALFEDTVEFNRLGLIIIDEQHRFGVHQRLSLRTKNQTQLRPHQLVMTATPIPRTLAMTAYADLDLSVIDQLPPGRTPVNTALISQKRRSEIIERVRQACQQGQQAYWVCTLVEDSESLAATAATELWEELNAELTDISVGLIHGRLKAAEKDQVMTQFKAGEIQLLVATTVIEVGVDVPNASLMIIENPERLGLAQLHQLRGRVGRGQRASHCVLLYGNPLSKVAKQRLQVMRVNHDGFVIAEEDLRIRGPGELLGTRQTGDLHFRLADLQRDAQLIPLIHETAANLIQAQKPLVNKLINRWFAHHQDFLKG